VVVVAVVFSATSVLRKGASVGWLVAYPREKTGSTGGATIGTEEEEEEEGGEQSGETI